MNDRKHPSFNLNTLTLHIRVTKKCNADCSYCSSFENSASQAMSEDQFKQSLEFIRDKIQEFGIAGTRKHLTIQYVGGEILTVGTEYLQKLKNIGDLVFKGFFDTVVQGVQSNLIGSENRVRNLYEIFDNNVGTSYDNHTSQRTIKSNPQAYQKIFLTNIRKIKETMAINVPGIVVIDKEMYPYAIDELNLANKNFRHLTFRPTFQGGSPVTSITDEDLSELYKKMFPLWFMKMRITVEPFFSLLKKRLATHKNDFDELSSFSGCPFQHNCVMSSINLDPNGDLYVCLDMADSKNYPLGNTLKKEFNSEVFHTVKSRSTKLSSDCINCDYYNECQGGCMNEAIESTGNLYGKTHYCGTWKTIFSMIDQGIKEHGIENVQKWIEKISQ